jgi:hypothetical protein
VLAVSFGLWRGESPTPSEGRAGRDLKHGAGYRSRRADRKGDDRFRGFQNPFEQFRHFAGNWRYCGPPRRMTQDAEPDRRRGPCPTRHIPGMAGASMVLGRPDHAILCARLLSLAINLVTIAAAGVGAYALLHVGAGRGWGSPQGSLRSGSSTV